VNIYTWGILASIAVYLVVGNWAARRVNHLDDYFVAGRRAPTLLVVGTLVASLLSTNVFLGEMPMAYNGFGSLILILVLVNVSGYVGGALLFGRHLRRSRALTVAEYFGQRFDCHRVQAAAGVTIIVGLGAYLVAVTQGAALVITQVSGLSYYTALVAVWVGYTIFTMSAGSRGVVITDTLMFLLFSLASVVALGYIIAAAGGWNAAIEGLARFEPRPGIISWHGANAPGASWEAPGAGLAWALILGFAWSAVVAVSPWQASRYLMAKDEHTVLRAACGSTLALSWIYPLLMLCGAAIALANPAVSPPEGAVLWAALHLMPAAAGALLMAGILAAGLSSATTFLSLVGFSTSHDILRRHAATERVQLRTSRLAMLAVSLVALALAAALPTRILWITYFAGTVFASSWGPVALMSVWSRRITARAALWGIVTGFVGNVLFKALSFTGLIELPPWADPILIGAVLSLLVILLVSGSGEVSAAEHRYRERLHQIPESELQPEKWRQTGRWPVYMMGSGLLLTALMLVFWVIPYGRSVAAAQGPPLGEILVSLGWGLSPATMGWILYRFLRRAPA